MKRYIRASDEIKFKVTYIDRVSDRPDTITVSAKDEEAARRKAKSMLKKSCLRIVNVYTTP